MLLRSLAKAPHLIEKMQDSSKTAWPAASHLSDNLITCATANYTLFGWLSLTWLTYWAISIE